MIFALSHMKNNISDCDIFSGFSKVHEVAQTWSSWNSSPSPDHPKKNPKAFLTNFCSLSDNSGSKCSILFKTDNLSRKDNLSGLSIREGEMSGSRVLQEAGFLCLTPSRSKMEWAWECLLCGHVWNNQQLQHSGCSQNSSVKLWWETCKEEAILCTFSGALPTTSASSRVRLSARELTSTSPYQTWQSKLGCVGQMCWGACALRLTSHWFILGSGVSDCFSRWHGLPGVRVQASPNMATQTPALTWPKVLIGRNWPEGLKL